MGEKLLKKSLILFFPLAAFLLGIVAERAMAQSHSASSASEKQNAAHSHSVDSTESLNPTLITMPASRESNRQELGSPSTMREDQSNNSISSAPDLAFSTASVEAQEGQSVDIPVSLVEGINSATEVEVVFDPGSSSATAEDLDNFNSSTVTFSDSDPTGTEKVITVFLTDDSSFEGEEKAVFILRNQSTGSIIDPDILTLTITDNDIPDVVINEFLPDPGPSEIAGGNRRAAVSEFVEIVNRGSEEIDISNWVIEGGDDSRFAFPANTVLKAGHAAVVFADTVATSYFGGAQLFVSSALSLQNSGGSVTLRDASGSRIDQLSYSSSEPGVSKLRSPDRDISNNAIITHSEPAATVGDFSPGFQLDGTAFGAKYAKGIRGSEGWRTISSPTRSTSFADLLKNIRVQGISGTSDADNPNASVLRWEESSGSFVTPASVTENLEPGLGYAVYFFDDEDERESGIQGGFPKVIDTNSGEGRSQPENPGAVTVRVSATDTDGNGIDGMEGWNMLGNPFGIPISVDALLETFEEADAEVNANIYVWAPNRRGGGEYVAYPAGQNMTIEPFQAFWVRFTEPGLRTEVTLNRSELAKKVQRGLSAYEEVPAFAFTLELHGEQAFDTYELQFSRDGSPGLDRRDAYKLFALNPEAIGLYSSIAGNKLMRNVLPDELDSDLEIPIHFDPDDRNSLTFQWKQLDEVPSDWNISLTDRENNRTINLRRATDYRFNIQGTPEERFSARENTLIKQGFPETGDSRFVLSIQPGGVAPGNASQLPESVKLNPNYPNPFTTSTTIPFELAEDSEVTLTIWNMIGQKVATLVDGMREAGSHTDVSWNANNMPSGIYIARFEVGGEVYTRKMTLIK